MTHPSRIGIVTTTRADWGLLRPVAERMTRSSSLEPSIIVSGTHLSAAHGATVAEVETDGGSMGTSIAGRIPLPLAGDDGVSSAADMAALLEGAARAYVELGLDAVLLLGDRTEILAAAAAAVPLGLPIIHLEGGHVTTGAVDDAVRHAVTKLAALHFTAAEPYRRRIIRMGEAPERVFVVGSTAVDRVRAAPVLAPAELSARAGLKLEPGFLLVTFHPETLADDAPGDQVRRFFQGLASVTDRKILITRPNADAGAGAVDAAIDAFVDARPEQAVVRTSLGADLYALCLRACDAVVGNSSSGVIEAPIAGVPTVNVGERQDGRLRAPSIIDCPTDPAAIAAALKQALDPTFRAAAQAQPSPFGEGGAAERIVAVLEATDFRGLARKVFQDVG